MIRNIDDEKKNLKRHCDSCFSGYLSEEALAELIEQAESQGMLHAPAHLKHNVLEQIRQEKRGAKKRQMFAYRAKVLVAMAAALTLLILMPDDRTEGVENMSIEQQADDSLEQMAMRRQEEMDANWERYLARRERGGVRGFFENLNERITEFAGMYDSNNNGRNKTDTESIPE